ncbi:glycosyltransferase [Pedobacter sp.]|uniref:glycosyltransferase n=1 Tax=Pedobacter sp. TaxID=1411316 RepID=UPI003D7F5733
MKLLHVIPTLDPQAGGMSQAIKTMVSGLCAQKVQSEVLSFDEPDAVYLQDVSVPIHALGSGSGPWNYNQKIMVWLLENLSKYDVVINHGLWCYQGYALTKAMKQLKELHPGNTVPRLFVMPHGMLDPYFQLAKDRKYKAWRNWVYWKLIEKRLIHAAEGLLFTCEEELIKGPFKPFMPKQSLVVGLGVDRPPKYTAAMKMSFEKKVPGLKNSSYLLFLSRIHEKKGIDLLITAYEKALMGGVTLAKLVIAGPGLDTPYGKKIQLKVFNDILLRRNVIFSGMVSGAAKWGAFYGCEAFILPSHQENFGVAVVEALSCGKPVLISNQVNIWREIKREGGCYVDDDTVEGTSRLLLQWKQTSPAQKELLSENAIKAFNKYFSTAYAAKRLFAAIN